MIQNKFLFIAFLVIVFNLKGLAQTNLVSNPSFEEYWGACSHFRTAPVDFNDNFDSLTNQNICVLKDWIPISYSPDVFSMNLYSNGFPSNFYSKHIYPHSDSSCVGGGQLFKGIPGGKAREQFENRLKDTLKVGHRYQFAMYVHLFDTIPANVSGEGKIVGINSFSAYFSDTIVNWRSNFDITRFTPQVQINQMVADTGHWVLLQDTFVATGGERYMCIGNFKPDSLLQWQLVDS